jgi:lysyl-tRNA synthetase class 2
MPPEPAPPPPPDHHEAHRLERQRRANRDAAAALGFAPYGARTDGLVDLAEARRLHNPAADEAHGAAGKDPPPGYVDPRPAVAVAGRVMLHRDNGRLVWMKLRDHTGDIQVAVSQREVSERAFALSKLVDLGDVLVARGRVTRTRTGEVTVWAQGEALEMAAKCLAPPPEKHAGLHDVEQRYRRRYVDLWANPETARVFLARSRIVSRIRRFMDEHGYVEVETPMLQSLAGGAAARPFITRMNALGIDLYLRIAPELYLKRLLVGGMPRVYEVNRNFRNEGLDRQHNPEFTMMEAYQAHGDVRSVMDLAEGLIRQCAAMVKMLGEDLGRDAPPGGAGAGPVADEGAMPEDLVLPFGDSAIDYGAPFARVAYADLFRRALGIDLFDGAAVRREAERRGLRLTNERGERLDDAFLANALFEAHAERLIDPARPTFVTDYPAAISPLTRPRADDPRLADRADLFIGGMEVGPFYTELNDPDVQERKFREQLAGLDEEESTFRTFDQDFIDALKVGMPPAGGFGLGIDRLTMLLTNQRTIRDVILFPLMRPVAQP